MMEEKRHIFILFWGYFMFLEIHFLEASVVFDLCLFSFNIPQKKKSDFRTKALC